MKKLVVYLKDIFNPKELHNLNVQQILMALSDSSVRKEWLYETFEEMKRLNLEVDKRLLSQDQWNIANLAARRKAYQDILESVLTARRRVHNPNPQNKSGFDLDSVTVESA